MSLTSSASSQARRLVSFHSEEEEMGVEAVGAVDWEERESVLGSREGGCLGGGREGGAVVGAVVIVLG